MKSRLSGLSQEKVSLIIQKIGEESSPLTAASSTLWLVFDVSTRRLGPDCSGSSSGPFKLWSPPEIRHGLKVKE